MLLAARRRRRGLAAVAADAAACRRPWTAAAGLCSAASAAPTASSEASAAAPAAPPALEPRAFNSLTQRLEAFPSGVLRWYACGPTVYDRAHLGHARAYVSQDIVRRVLERRFGRHLWLVLGVTDVDDKIIARARALGIGVGALARAEERAFLADMARLHVRPPAAITRVSEHMGEITAYVETILARGFAYPAADDSGVYFATRALGAEYGKLAPPPARAQQQHAEDDDATAEAAEALEPHACKRDPRDFALWKRAKAPDEPAWASPWGPGRPGWHIECSAMTHHVLGPRLDVHTGGIDLKFPHHNNEIAQCEAHNHGNDGNGGPWCRHFLHFGHLYIRGLKMSKSLKNFISVRDFLNEHSADQFRLFCLQHRYRANIHYAPDRIRDAAVVEDRLRNFLRNVAAYHRPWSPRPSTTDEAQGRTPKRCDAPELGLLERLFETKVAFDTALADDFDTPRALGLVLELVARGNEYLLARRDVAPPEVLGAVVTFVLEALDVFGLEGLLGEFRDLPVTLTTPADDDDDDDTTRHADSHDRPHHHDHDGHDATIAGDVLDALVQFRARVRELALADPRHPANAQILGLCDALRDDGPAALGVQIEDLAPGRSAVKFLTPDEREHARRAAETSALPPRPPTPEASTLAARQRAFAESMQIAPASLFREAPEYRGKYAQFDADGVPTHDVENAPLSKSQRKKLQKKLEKHAASYAKFWADKS